MNTTRIKKVLLFLAGVVALTIFFLLPPNKVWFKKRIIGYWNDFKVQKKNLHEDYRMRTRFGDYFTYTKQIEYAFYKKSNPGNELILIPPTGYFKQYGIKYHVPEPAVFYYFTGLKTIWANSTGAVKANWYVSVSEGKLVIDSVAGRHALTDTIAAFRKYPTSL